MMLRTRLFTRIFIGLLAGVAFVAPCAADEIISLDEMLEPIRAQEKQPAMAVAVVRGDEVIASGAVGVTEWGGSDNVTTASLFHIGSCTKAMTATMIAAFIEEGELNWDTTVADVLPGLVGSLDPTCEKITVRQLMTHTAGMPGFTSRGAAEMEVLNKLSGSPMEQRGQFLEALLVNPPVTPPGTKMAYSNAGYGVLTDLIETRTNIAWADLMKMKLFVPLGMKSAGFGWPRDAKHPGAPLGHWQRGEVDPAPHQPDGDYTLDAAIAPAGDVHCNVLDLAKFATLHLRGLRGEDGFLKAATIRKLHEPALDSYACGWVERNFGKVKVSWHNGSAGTFFTWMTIAPERNLAVVVMTNAGGGENACKLATVALIKRFAPDDEKEDSNPAPNDVPAPTETKPAVP